MPFAYNRISTTERTQPAFCYDEGRLGRSPAIVVALQETILD